MKKSLFKKRIKSLLSLLIIFELVCPLFAVTIEAHAAGKSVEAGNFAQLQAALNDTTVDTIIITNDIDVNVSYVNAKSTTALLVADRNLTIMGKDAHQYTIKRTGATIKNAKSLLEIWGNGTYDGVQVSIYNVKFDGGAVYDAGSTPDTRWNGNSNAGKPYLNTGIAGHGVIDVANKGTLNMEDGAWVVNGVAQSNSNTRNAQGMDQNGGSVVYGGGIRVEFQSGGTVNMKAGSAIYDCCASGYGAGIGAYNYARLNLYGGTISRCAANNGGGIGVTYRDNTASNTGGSINVFGGTISNCYSPGYGGALCIYSGTDNYILGGTFTNNTAATENGGGMLVVHEGNVYLSDMNYFTLSGNTAGNYSDNRGATGKSWTTAGGIFKKVNTATIMQPSVYTVTFMMDGAQYSKLNCVYGTSLGEAFPGDPVKQGGYFNGWYSGSTRYDSKSLIMNNVTLTGRMHYHDFTYSADAATVSALCSGEYDCPYKETPVVYTLTSTGNMEYNRKLYNGIGAINEITSATGEEPSAITYYKLTGGEEVPVLVNNVNSKPMDVGSYRAKATIGGKTAQIDFKIVAPDTNYSTMSMADDRKVLDVENSARPANGSAVTSNLRVYVPDTDISIKVYKIGEMLWSETNQDYYEPQWVAPVRSWIEDSETYGTSTTFKDPWSIGNATSNVQIEFYGALLAEDGGLFDEDGYNLQGPARISENAQEGTDTFFGQQDGDDYIQFSNLTVGVYAVLAEGGYQPMVVSVLPYQSGPNETWYIAPLFTLNMKTVAMTLNKYINGEDIADTVEMGEIVDFNIELSELDLYKDRMIYFSGEQPDYITPYQLYLEDYLSDGFELIKDLDGKYYMNLLFRYTGDTTNLQGNGIYDMGEGLFTFPSSVTYVGFGDESIAYDKNSFLVTEENYQWTLNDGRDLLDQMTAEGRALYAYRTSGPVAYMDYYQYEPEDTYTFKVYFVVEALKSFITQYGLDESKMTIVINYQAKVNENIQLNSDDNTNRVVLTYEKSPGYLDTQEDTVYGYTYGLKVVKIDGDTLGTDNVTYLGGVVFRLYREIEGEPQEYMSYYEYEDIDRETGEKKIRYFEPYNKALLSTETTWEYELEATFRSTDTADGVVLTGLKDGCYVLEEVTALTGYNKIDGDMYFEINRLDSTEANENYMGKLRYFYETSNEDGTKGNLNQSGYMQIDVLNYKGLVLPSTGGVGTLLFTMIGLGLMGTVIAMIVIRRRRDGYEEWVVA